MNKKLIIIETVETLPELTLDELCSACSISPELIQQMIDLGIIEPKQNEQMVFASTQLHRVRTMMRLQKDLEVNLAGAALAIELLDELEELRGELRMLEKYLGHI